MDFSIFSIFEMCWIWSSILVVKISNHRYTLRMCKNHENLIFEWGVFFGPKNPAESIATTFRMIRALQMGDFCIFLQLFGPFWSKNHDF